MTPNEFDIKYKEFKEIEQRMAGYSKDTPLSNVMADHAKAKTFYSELTSALSDFQKQITSIDKNDEKTPL